MLEKVGLEHSSKSAKYELERSCDDLVHESLSLLHIHDIQLPIAVVVVAFGSLFSNRVLV